MGLPVVRTGNVALDRFLESVREYIETSKGNGNVNSVDRVLRVSDLASIVQLSAASAAVKAKELTQSDVEKLAMDLSNTRLFKSLTSSGSALDGVVDGLPREVLADVRANANNSLSAVTSEAIVSTTDTQAVAAQVTTVSASLTGLAGDVATVETAYLALASDVGGLEAQYTIKVRAGGAIAGIGLAASDPGEGGATSSVIISADKFAVVPAGSTGIAGSKVPFTINTGTNKINFTSDVEIDGNLLVDGTITTDKLDANSVWTKELTASFAGAPSASILNNIFLRTPAGSYLNFSSPSKVNWSSTAANQYCIGHAANIAGSANFNIGVYGAAQSVPAVGYPASGLVAIGVMGDGREAGLEGYGGVFTGLTADVWLAGSKKLRWGDTYTYSAPTGTGTLFLCNDGTWATPASGSVAWTSVTGKPSTFPPDSHTHDYAASSHTHSGYQTAEGTILKIVADPGGGTSVLGYIGIQRTDGVGGAVRIAVYG